MKAIVLGAREGNIGGAILDGLNLGESRGWTAVGSDCYVPGLGYLSPSADQLAEYDACVITLGTTHMEPFGEQSNADIALVLRGSLELPLICAKNYVKGRGAQGGIIVFIGSYAHDHVFTHCTTYCVAKAGLDMACRSLAWELMPIGFCVHIIHPHHVQGTPMTDEVRRGMMEGIHHMTEEEAEAYSRKDLRMPDLLTPEEVAEVVMWLVCAPAAAWTSGSGIELRGGVR